MGAAELSIWRAILRPTKGAGAAHLYGTDGDKLVFVDWLNGVMHLSWYPQPQALTIH